ncbi:hypothetical protein [Myroides marinus]|uniref:hypothetical protein n=1 Tax=Myroides marinus TaxID=703342 RepID=UPI002575ABD6|nr:hypothetical protein [Myroides marinus]MDM1345728.1 hypothetical protein [Myroides marinus]MDM1378792.1 hypothetical protein [Myroides marinus]MDM1386063.1 hypothetical protein [Myroides marinus]MDM1393276.1 hypothetical protein [Myroides marinus]
MELKEKTITESIRLKSNKVTKIKAIVGIGRDGDYYIAVSPAFLIAGYGKTEEEAINDFDSNIKTFVFDLNAMSNTRRESYLISLGFVKERFATKNFSKAYVDSEGILNDLEKPRIAEREYEAA